MTLTTSGRKRVNKDGTIHKEVRARYACHYNIRHPGECDGQSGYGVTKLDGLVSKIVCMQFEKIKKVSAQALIAGQRAKEIEFAKAKLKLASDNYQEKKQEYDDLRAETIKVIRGTSQLNAELLNELVEEAADALQQAESDWRTAQAELNEYTESAESVRQEYAQLISWAEMYENSSFEAKKMILAQFVKAVYVRRNYELDILFNVSFKDFQACVLGKRTAKGPEQLCSGPPYNRRSRKP